MGNSSIAKASVTIKAPAAKVWTALITPELIKQYLFGTNAVSDWKVGSPIFYRGEWEGKPYEDKGIITNSIPEKLLETTYWSAAFGPDIPENYKKVSYELAVEGNTTVLTITQDNNTTEESRAHSEQNWNMVLGKLKEIVEK